MEYQGRFDYRQFIKKGHRLPVLRYLNVDHIINRRVGGLIVRAVYGTRITPNQLTYVSFLLNLCGAALFCLAHRPYLVAGAFVQLFSNFFDAADGMLARSKRLSSDYGATLDLILDRISDLALYGSTIVAFYRSTYDSRLAIAALAGLAVFYLQVVLYYLVEAYKKTGKTGMSGETRALVSWLIFVCALVGRLEILMWTLIIEPVANVIFRVFYFYRLGRRRPS